MPLITPDTSEALDMSPIPAGTYKAKITKTETGTSGKGNPKVVVHFDVTVPERKSVMKRQAHLALKGQGSGGFDQLLRACGFDAMADVYKDGNVTTKPPFNSDDLDGKEVQLVIVPGINPKTQQPNDQIQTYLKP